MLMKASQTGKTISRVLVQTADWHYNQASQWWDMYQHCVTEGATFVDEQNDMVYDVPDGLIHPDLWHAAQNYLARYRYHTGIGDRIMSTGAGVVIKASPRPSQPVDYAAEFEKAVEQRGQIAAEAFKSRRRKFAARPNVQRASPNGQDTVETLH